MNDPEKFFSALLHRTNLVVYLKDADGRYIYINRRYEELAQVTQDMIVGKTDAEIFPPAVAALFRSQDAEVIKHGGPLQFEETIPLPGGECSFLSEKFSMRDADGTLTAVGGICTEVTEQDSRLKAAEKSAETDRLKAQALLNATGKIAKVGSWRHDTTTLKATWTDEMFHIYGLPVGEVPDLETAISFFHPDDRPIFIENIRLAQEQQRPYDSKLRFINTRGEHLWVQVQGQPIIIDGKTVELQGVLMNITEQMNAKKELREMATDWRDVLAQVHEAITIHDKDFNIVSMNPAAEKLLGGHAQEILSQKCFKSYHGTDAPPRDCPSCQTLKTHTSCSSEIFEPHLGKWIELQASPRFDEQNNPVGIIHVVRDITEKRAAAEALRLNRDLLNRTARIARVGGWSLETATMQLSWSEEVFRIHGLDTSFTPTVDKAIGFYAPEHVPVITKAVQEAIESGKTFDLELTILTANGDRREVRAIGEVEIEDGRTAKVWGTIQDITDLVRTEKALANLQKLESLGVLAGGIAHDFNNILTGIIGNLSLAQHEAEAGGKLPELIEESLKACATAKGLTHQLLTFAKGGSPALKILRLAPILRDAGTFATRGTKSKCEFDISEDLDPANIDKDQLAQVLQNLVINATQAMPRGGKIVINASNIELGISDMPHLQGGRYIKITVTDQGVGIHRAQLPNIFDPYFSTKAQGRGLGLASCFSIIKKHNGHLCVESTSEKGSVFSIYLPAADPGKIAPGIPAHDLTKGSGKILIMDDEAMVARVLARILEKMGYTSETASDGNAALAAYAEAKAAGRPFDLIIMDLTIPGGLGGKETIKKLKERDAEAKAIVSSGYSNDPIVAEYAAHGFEALLSKPYSLEEVSVALSQALRKSPKN